MVFMRSADLQVRIMKGAYECADTSGFEARGPFMSE
jgi:hypothetical protein